MKYSDFHKIMCQDMIFQTDITTTYRCGNMNIISHKLMKLKKAIK